MVRDYASSLVDLSRQIALGGWVSTNYAALACADLPLCNGELVPARDFANAVHIFHPLDIGPDGALLKLEALRAIRRSPRPSPSMGSPPFCLRHCF